MTRPPVQDDIANQMTEIVPIHRIIEEIGYMYKKGATNYTIINVSDIKPVPLSLEAVMAFLWDPSPFLAAPTPRAAQHTFTVQWCQRMFGADVAADIANVYVPSPVEFVRAVHVSSCGRHGGVLARQVRAVLQHLVLQLR